MELVMVALVLLNVVGIGGLVFGSLRCLAASRQDDRHLVSLAPTALERRRV